MSSRMTASSMLSLGQSRGLTLSLGHESSHNKIFIILHGARGRKAYTFRHKVCRLLPG
jgi:hypothetical protein